MSSVYRKDDLHVEKPKRNVYSKTHSKSLTTKFGQIMPVFCQPVMNGESFTMSYKHIFNMLPFVFPVQTRVRASFSLYYVRWRNLWKDWEDFQFKMKPNLVKPYHKFTRETRDSLLRVGGPLDNMGIPVVTYHNTPSKIFLDNPKIQQKNFEVYNPYTNTYDLYDGQFQYLVSDDETVLSSVQSVWDYDDIKIQSLSPENTVFSKFSYAPYRYPIKADGITNVKFYSDTIDEVYLLCRCVKPSIGEYKTTTIQRTTNSRVQDSERRSSGYTQSRGSVGSDVRTTETEQNISTISIGQESKFIILRVKRGGTTPTYTLDSPEGYQLVEVLGRYYPRDVDHTSPTVGINVRPSDYPTHGIHLSDVALDFLPYANEVRDDETTIRLDAGPMRGVESIYNALVRHPENNPFLVDGVPEYNKFLLSYEGGADTYNYPQRYANWQDDQFTTGLHSPQHGDAPLVGLVNQANVNSIITFANDNGTKTRVNFFVNNSDSTPPVRVIASPEYNNSGNVPDTPSLGYVGELDEGALDATKFGFTINDFRNVNSYQRWLENNVRRGYKYRDQIKAHYGVAPRYDVLDMPEYLGGSSRDMNVNQITQTVENENGALGDYAGQGYINGGSNHSITHFCDEEGFIIGLLTIMPVANYSQIIPKFFLRNQALDYFSPEFGKIGMQPILNREIDPIGSFYDGTGDKVFAYQRPWYDYLDIPDTIHGKFRTEFRNFVLTRTFSETPKLAEDFLVYDPDQVNNIFYVDDDEDKILGQFLFDYKVRIPIPLYGIPALE